MTEQDAGVLVQQVRRRFGAVEALRGLDLHAPRGEVTALIGPNGAGKTTLLLVLATLLTPDSGQVRVAGVDLLADPVAARGHIGWMPDTFGTYDQLTTVEYLEFFTEAYRLPRDTGKQRIAELLDLVHLGEFAEQPVHVLSRGQKQRLGVARALVHRPDVLLLDEPASGLDPRSRIELRDVIRQQAKEGAAVLVSSHILSELEEMADRAVFVDGGVSVSAHSVRDFGSTWRIRALGDGLTEALDRRDVEHRTSESGVDIRIDSEEHAADLLGELVADGVRVVAFGPSGHGLESTYLALTEDRR